MKNLLYILGFSLLVYACGQTKSTQTPNETEADLKLEKLASGFVWAEGPAADKDGNIYFSDVRQSMILIWTIDDQLDTFRLNTGRANGLFFDENQNLLICEMDSGRVSSISPSGDHKVIASSYQGTRFNATNDLWLDAKGGIYFTDPKFGKPPVTLSQDGMYVYYLSPDHSTVTRVCDDIEKPNGLVGTPDGKTLYVTDVQVGETYQFDIQKDGSLANKKLFVPFGCDGMTIDDQGNIYLSTLDKNAIDVFSPSGKLLKTIQGTERMSNACFGGKDGMQLFVTGATSLYRVRLDPNGFN